MQFSGEKVVTDVTANDGSWTFLCASWASRGGLWKIYKNGALADHGQGLAEGLVVGDAGTLVLGQEQDSPGLVILLYLHFKIKDLWLKVRFQQMHNQGLLGQLFSTLSCTLEWIVCAA